MATDGMWTMTDEGEFILMEPYKTQLHEARFAATAAWTEAMLSYLAEYTDYSTEFMKDELVRRCTEEGVSANDIVNEFVLEALSHDL